MKPSTRRPCPGLRLGRDAVAAAQETAPVVPCRRRRDDLGRVEVRRMAALADRAVGESERLVVDAGLGVLGPRPLGYTAGMPAMPLWHAQRLDVV